MTIVQPAINFMILEITGLVLIVCFTILRIRATWKKSKSGAEITSEVLYVLSAVFSATSCTIVSYLLHREVGVRKIAKSELDLYVKFNSPNTLKVCLALLRLPFSYRTLNLRKMC